MGRVFLLIEALFMILRASTISVGVLSSLDGTTLSGFPGNTFLIEGVNVSGSGIGTLRCLLQ